MPTRVYNVLFVSDDNTARSILAEAILNKLGENKFKAYSAGSRPASEINPYAMELLEINNLSKDHLQSKNWNEFSQSDSVEFDFVFTLSESAAKETSPKWRGQPITANWFIESPTEETGHNIDKKRAFNDAYKKLQRRISFFASLPFEKLNALSLKHEVEVIGSSQA